jgi:malonyl-CoA O-methyltransferase
MKSELGELPPPVPPEEVYRLPREAVRRSFHAASATYDQAAALQQEVRSRLLERLDVVRLTPTAVLDLGAGTGHATRQLKQRYPKATVVAMDLAFGMLQYARKQQSWRRRFARVCADAQRVALREHSVDLVFSSLMLQWCNDPDAVFSEARRVLRPGGLLTFTTLGPDTLRELRAAWRSVDPHTHVNQFVDMHDIGDALVRARFADPVLDVERITLTFPDVFALMRELKAIGAHNVTAGRRAGLTGRGAIQTMAAAYEQFRRDGKLPATYEVVYGHAWAPLSAPDRKSRSGEVTIAPDQIGRRR